MDGDSADKRALRERIRDLGDEVTALKKAIHEELDWRDKARTTDAADDDDEAV